MAFSDISGTELLLRIISGSGLQTLRPTNAPMCANLGLRSAICIFIFVYVPDTPINETIVRNL